MFAAMLFLAAMGSFGTDREGLRRRGLEQDVAAAWVIVVATALDSALAPAKRPGDLPDNLIRFQVKQVLKGKLADQDLKTRTPTAAAEFLGKDWVILLSPDYMAGKHQFATLIDVTLEPTVKAALACPADDATGDLRQMEGTWEAKRYFADGKEWSDRELATMKLIVKGAGENELILGNDKHFGTYRLGESASGKTIDITITQGPNKGKKKLGLYELKGDTLRLCVGHLGGERPKEFVSKPTAGVWLEEWKRRR